jgi:mannose-6-phosphate isomerase-like protein (cupin superfamily)
VVLVRGMEHAERPWGEYCVIDQGEGYKVKRICVRPGGRLSLQRHRQRAEHWFVVTGVARVTRDDEVVGLTSGESVDIPLGARHRLENPAVEPLVLIEIQRGDYLGEDDIERFADDYGRVAE